MSNARQPTSADGVTDLPTEYLSRDEIDCKLVNLSEHERKALTRIAKARVGQDHADLLQDVFMSFMNERRWPAHEGTMRVIIGAIKSLASARAEKQARERKFLGIFGPKLYEDERQRIAECRMESDRWFVRKDALQCFVSSLDPLTRKILDDILEGFTSPERQHMNYISQTQDDMYVQRIRRATIDFHGG